MRQVEILFELAGEFADMKDFDTLRMTEDFARGFPVWVRS
jgi:hypothetical protein